MLAKLSVDKLYMKARSHINKKILFSLTHSIANIKSYQPLCQILKSNITFFNL